nr:PREDICTED: Rieske domain-containing protein isoform X1 [Lepisosteus oculatus]
MPSADGGVLSAFVGKKEDVVRSGRALAVVHGREVVVIHHAGAFYAMDRLCYHAGGPLYLGDIEDVEGRQCIVCPWHKYRITLAEGEGLYQAVDPRDPQRRASWGSKGPKQRTHAVHEESGDLFVTLSDLSLRRESDYYQSEEYQQVMRNAKKN